MKPLPEPMAEAHGTAVACLTCELDFDEFRDPLEARHFARVHNELHAHGLCLGAIDAGVDEAGDTTDAGQESARGAVEAAVSERTAAVVDEDGW